MARLSSLLSTLVVENVMLLNLMFCLLFGRILCSTEVERHSKQGVIGGEGETMRMETLLKMKLMQVKRDTKEANKREEIKSSRCEPVEK